MKQVAQLLDVRPRTVRRWKQKAGGARRVRGRPPGGDCERLGAARRIAMEWREQGKSSGWRPVAAALRDVSTRLVQEELAKMKRRHRVAKARREAARRTQILPAGRDVMWSLDATHLGRSEARCGEIGRAQEGQAVEGQAVEGQAVRDVASTRTLAATVGDVVATQDAMDVMSAAALERGGYWPLVLVSDNGSPYTSKRFEDFLEEHDVLHLKSLPHTPQQNPWVERGHRDLKEETGLGKGVRIGNIAKAREAICKAVERLDGHRLRRCHGYRTACAVDAQMPVPYDEDMRAVLAQEVCRRVKAGLHDHLSARARRMVHREAILAALEEHGLIKRTRGGRGR